MNYRIKLPHINNSILLLFVSIALFACGGGTENHVEPLKSDASRLSGTWVGQYECGQGLTGMSLSITGNGEAVNATWNFYGVIENPDNSLGSAKYSGSYDFENNLSLSGVAWINKPDGHVMPVISGKANAQQNEILGNICGNNVTLRKVPPPDLTQVSGEWIGTYTCAQGNTGIILSIQENGSKLNATFDFFGLPTNPDVPVGSYTLEGIFDSSGNIDLEPVRWINQPTGWSMEGFEARLNPVTGTLDGNICGNTSALTKTNQLISSENINGNWTGSYTCPEGETGLTLAIDGNGKNVIANFSFYEVSSNPGVPSGSYVMQGIYNGNDLIDLEPRKWIDRPFGYNYLGFEAFIDINSGALSGTLCNASFTLIKE